MTRLNAGHQANLTRAKFFRQPCEQVITQRDQPMPKCRQFIIAHGRV
jgi:hypothetical protein